MKLFLKLNKQIKTFLLLMLFAGLLTTNAQQNYLFREFKDNEKLSNNAIVDFYQDSFGFLWLASADGLNRYDGNNVKIYKNRNGDNTTLPDNETQVLLEDAEQNIWVGCFNSIAKLDRKNEKFTSYTLDHLQKKNFVTFFTSLLDKDGNLWFGNSQHGVLRFNKIEQRFDQIPIAAGENNLIWGEVHKIIELKNGAILVADYKNGLLKYNKDKDHFEKYNLKPGYSPRKINSIFEDSKGNIWFGGSNLLIKYSPSQYIVENFDLLTYSNTTSNYQDVMSIIEDNNGDIWVSLLGHGIYKIDNQSEKFQQFTFENLSKKGISNNLINVLYKDKYGVIWIAFRGGGINTLNTQTEPFAFDPLNILRDNQLISTTVNRIQPSKTEKNKLILGTSSEGIFSLDLVTKETKKIMPLLNKNEEDSLSNIGGLITDVYGNIWFAENENWIKKLNNKNEIVSFNNPHTEKTALPLTIASIKYSPNGNIWVTSNSGVDKYMPETDSVFSIPRTLNKKIDPSLKSKVVDVISRKKSLASILLVGEGQNIEEEFSLDKKKKVLLVSVGEGRALGAMYDFGSLITTDGKIIWSMNDLEKSFNLGGGYKNRISLGCVELEAGDYKLQYTSDIGHSYGNWNTAVPADSNWWGIQVFDLTDEEFKDIDEHNKREIASDKYLPFEMARCIEFSKKYSNNVWIGTSSHSFFRYDLSSGNYRNYNFDSTNLSSTMNVVFCLYEDLDGIVWAGTYSGLVRLEPDTEKLDIFTTDEGLPGGLIYSITEDNNGALWLNTSGGFSKLNKNAPIEEYAFINYDSRDGLTGQVRSGAVWKNENGRLYFGGKNGIISFKPGKINQFKPDIVIHDMKIEEVSIFDDSSSIVLDTALLAKKEIDLEYYQNDLSFDFSAIHFTRPQKNKISYKLEGYNKDWVESNRNYASFTNLDPGVYNFKVKGANGDGIWNEEGKSLTIIIHPQWWKTTTAYVGYGVLFLLSAFGVDRYQRRRLLSKARERMKIQDAEHRAKTAELQSRAVQAENNRQTKELEEARALQLSMLPKELPALPNLDIAVYMKTATEVGGDYYDFHLALDGTLTVVLGDATGHGMRAGTMVTAVKGLFNSYSANPDILYSFQEISRCLKEMNLDKLSMCMTMLKIQGNQMMMSSAGMPPLFIFRKKEGVVEEQLLNGMPLGSISKFPYKMITTEINSGDTILMMTDGFPELQNDKEDLYGYPKAKNSFEEVAEKSPEQILDYLKEEGSRWVKDLDPDDDVTFVVIKVK